MNSLVVLTVLVAVTLAAPKPDPKPLDQFVAVNQDSLGNYNIRYAIGDISRVEQRSVLRSVNDGLFIDAHGILRRAEIVPAVHSLSAIDTEIPVVVRENPEIAILRTADVASPAHLVSSVLEVPVALGTTTGQLIPEVPLVRSVPVASAPVVNVAGVPEVLRVESRQIPTAHVARTHSAHVLV